MRVSLHEWHIYRAHVWQIIFQKKKKNLRLKHFTGFPCWLSYFFFLLSNFVVLLKTNNNTHIRTLLFAHKNDVKSHGQTIKHRWLLRAFVETHTQKLASWIPLKTQLMRHSADLIWVWFVKCVLRMLNTRFYSRCEHPKTYHQHIMRLNDDESRKQSNSNKK